MRANEGGQPAFAAIRKAAPALRRSATDAESRLWYHLRGRRFSGFKFRRQHPIGPYVVDFVCLDAALVIELDGSQHLDQVQYDERRTGYLTERGFKVLRFWDNDVLNATENVLEAIHTAMQSRPSPQPSPASGRG